MKIYGILVGRRSLRIDYTEDYHYYRILRRGLRNHRKEKFSAGGEAHSKGSCEVLRRTKARPFGKISEVKICSASTGYQKNAPLPISPGLGWA